MTKTGIENIQAIGLANPENQKTLLELAGL